MDKTPKHAAISDYITSLISSGELAAGDRIPKETELAQKFSVSRITVQRAMRTLIENGAVTSIQGSGTYVRDARVETSEHADGKLSVPFVIGHSETGGRFFEIVQGTEQYLTENNCQMNMYITNNDADKEKLILRRLTENSARCILIMPHISDANVKDSNGGNVNAKDTNADFLSELLRTDIPMVFIGCKPNGMPANCVCSDNFGGGYMATAHLLKNGYKRIAFIGDAPKKASSVADRFAGYMLALSEYGAAQDVHLTAFGDITAGAERLLALKNPPDAIFASSDSEAASICALLDEKGIRIPDDIAVIGFDNAARDAEMRVPLSSINQRFYDIGREAAKLCLEIMRGEGFGYTQRFIPVTLVERASTRAKK
ncbi:MAG: GntR family transcriptional regulator [Eubacteriales bacterium]